MSSLSRVLSGILGCNVVTRAATGKQAAGPSNPLPPPNRGEAGSLAEQEVQAAQIFEERRSAIQQERQALDDSRNRFLAALAAHPAMASRPIVRNAPEVEGFISEANADAVCPAPTNHRAVSRGSVTPLSGILENPAPALAATAAVAALIEGSAERRLEDGEVQSFRHLEGAAPRRLERRRSPLRAEIAERQDPGRCPDYGVGGQEGRNPLPLRGANISRVEQMAVTRDNFAAMIEEHLCHRGRPLEAARFSAGEPLTERARTTLLPPSWVTPRFIRFDGRGDPDLHLMEFRTLMAPNDSDDQLTRVFKQSLKDQALQWYVRLPHDSIDSFEDLSTKFVRQYSCNLVQPKRVESLFDLRMEAKESLKDFVSRFRSEAIQVEDAAGNEAMIYTAFRNALLDGHQMKVDLLMKPKTRLQDLYEHADRRIRVEVDASRKRKPSVVHMVENQPPKQCQLVRVQEPVQRAPEKRRPWGIPPREDFGPRRPVIEPPRPPTIDPQKVLSLFSLTAEAILDRIKGKSFFTYPPPVCQDLQFLNLQKNCKYHRSSGHLTRECKGFAALLQDLVKKGLVDELLRRNQGPSTSAQKMKGIVLDEDARDVDVIHGFCAVDDVTEGRLKRKMDAQLKVQESNKRQFFPQIVAAAVHGSMSFGDDDMEGISLPHGDGLIIMISLRVGAGFPARNVKRILVDGGSAVDIMFVHCFDALAIPQSNLRPSGTTLSGFSGEKADVVGEVDIDMIAAPRTLCQRFIVVMENSPYNAILGRPWLHMMKAVPSTYHQCLKYPSSQGIIRIRGNQYAAMASAVDAAKRGLCPEDDKSGRVLSF